MAERESLFDSYFENVTVTQLDTFGVTAYRQDESNNFTISFKCIFDYSQEYIDSQSEQVIISSAPGIYFNHVDNPEIVQGTNIKIGNEYYRVSQILKETTCTSQAELYKYLV